MTRDKQLRDIDLDQVVEKRRLDQALNAKEFAVLAGISYSAARAWLRLPGFPVVRGVVFWEDFVNWRRRLHAATGDVVVPPPVVASEGRPPTNPAASFPARAAKILAEVG